MDSNRLTTQAQSALQDAGSLAEQLHHQTVGIEHLFAALMKQENGLVPRIFSALGKNPAQGIVKFNDLLSRKPKVYSDEKS
ncbi:MAG: Clp protease N-terminal domain-containing protein, partial [Planctomycetota bacterium]